MTQHSTKRWKSSVVIQVLTASTAYIGVLVVLMSQVVRAVG